MNIDIRPTKQESGRVAAAAGAEILRAALAERGSANVILATGASQFDMLSALARAEGIDWGRVYFFHLDEYEGLNDQHPASFRRYLRERFVEQLPTPPAAFHYISGEGDLAAECNRLGGLISEVVIDAAFIGIGENGHLAFNDPPADFATEAPYIVVELDEACRRQQFDEGWFPTLEEVPRRAISMSIDRILRSRHILCTVPDERKAEAVAAAVEGALTPELPASILRLHARATLFLDQPAASRLSAVSRRILGA